MRGGSCPPPDKTDLEKVCAIKHKAYYINRIFESKWRGGNSSIIYEQRIKSCNFLYIFTKKTGTCCLRDGDEMEQRADVILKRGGGRLLKSGGAWVFDNEIAEVKGFYLNGDLVRVTDFDGYPLGTGFINRNSKIRVRMLTRDADEAIDAEFFRKRIRAAWEYRKKVTDISSCRVIFGEADDLPGITIDKYEDVLVVESLALGMDRRKEEIVDILKEVLAEDGIRIRGVYERSDAKERLKEGMERKKGFIGPEFDTNVRITENGVKYIVDVKDGQKTGFFLDQKYNRSKPCDICRRFAERD